MAERMPAILVTGASGLVGRHFLEAARDRFLIYALARRSAEQAGIPSHPRVRWIQADIGNREALARVLYHVGRQGPVDFLLHLAAFYDFSNEDDPEFERTNVRGTRHLLELAGGLGIRRFVFASSLVVTEFPSREGPVTERSPTDADFPYARSKRKGEELVRRHAERFPCSIVRLAAVVSDWCEYPPLYAFLSTWLSPGWTARVLAGRGKTAVPYIHVHDLTRLLLTLLDRSEELPRLGVYLASPDGCTTHQELFRIATRCYFGRPVRPRHLPKPLAGAGILGRLLLGRLLGRPPFERPWMTRYIDRQLVADASCTRRALGWEPTPRYHITRRLLFMIERLKNSPIEWLARNQAALLRAKGGRPNLLIYENLLRLREKILEAYLEYVTLPANRPVFPGHGAMDRGTLRRSAELLFRLLAAAVRSGDRMTMLDSVRELARIRRREGFSAPEVCGALTALRDAAVPELLIAEDLMGREQAVFDHLFIPVQMATDEVEDVFEQAPEGAAGDLPAARLDALERRLLAMEEFYGPVPAGGPGPDPGVARD